MKINELIAETMDLLDEIFIENEALKILEESKIFDTLSLTIRRLDANVKEMNHQLFNGEQAKVKETFKSVVDLAKKAGQINNTYWNDYKTQKAVYLVYSKKILPMFKEYYRLCEKWNSENDSKLPLDELKAVLSTTKQGDTSKANFETEKRKVFNY